MPTSVTLQKALLRESQTADRIPWRHHIMYVQKYSLICYKRQFPFHSFCSLSDYILIFSTTAGVLQVLLIQCSGALMVLSRGPCRARDQSKALSKMPTSPLLYLQPSQASWDDEAFPQLSPLSWMDQLVFLLHRSSIIQSPCSIQVCSNLTFEIGHFQGCRD